MRIEIVNTGSGDGMNTKLDVHLIHDAFQGTYRPRPFCQIEEQDFFNLLPDVEFDRAQCGKIHFNVPIEKLREACIKVYSNF